MAMNFFGRRSKVDSSASRLRRTGIYRSGAYGYVYFSILVLVLLSFTIPKAQARSLETDSHKMVVNPIGELEFPEAQEAQSVYVGPRIVVNLPARELTLFDEKNTVVKTYPIAIGMNRYPTPIGPRRMVQIVWNPWWIPPKGRDWTRGAKDTPPGPSNPLGSVKMNLESAILIHGTNKPETIGHLRSHACIRMYNEDARELAAYIQKKVTEKTDTALFEKYRKYSRRSFYVNLEKTVLVDIIYDLVAVKDQKLFVYRDVYWRVSDKIKVIKDELREAGYRLNKFDWDYIKKEIEKNRNKNDLVFEIEDLLSPSPKGSLQRGHPKGSRLDS